MDLTLNAKYVLATKLGGNDLIRLCATNTEMRKICNSEKFNPIWISKLKEDYNVDYLGKDGYMEYLQNTYFYKNHYYTVVYTDMDRNEVISVELFKNRNDAIADITTYVIEYPSEMSYPIIKAKLETLNEVEIYPIKINLYEGGTFKTKKQYNYEERYENKLKELANMVYPNNKEAHESFIFEFKEFVSDLSENEIDNLTIRNDLTDLLEEAPKHKLNSIIKFIHNLITDPMFI